MDATTSTTTTQPGDALSAVVERAKRLRNTQLPCITLREAHYTRVLNAVLGSKTDWWRKLLAAVPDSATATAAPPTTVADRWKAEAEAALIDMGLAFDLAYRYGSIDGDSTEPLAKVRESVGWVGVRCDECSAYDFPGPRFVCQTCPPSYDLCVMCYLFRKTHDATHEFKQMRLSLDLPPETAEDIRESAKAAAAFMIEELRDIAARAMLRYSTPRCKDEAVAWPTASHGVIVSDTAVPESLRRRIADLAEPLVAASLDAGRWHPGSDGLVLDLIHPSDYPLCFGRTLFSATPGAIVGESVVEAPAKPEPTRWGSTTEADVSYSFQWLPSEFRVAADGSVTIDSYVNNLDEKAHPELFQTIAEVFERILPMLECTIGSADAVPDERRDNAPYSESSFSDKSEWEPTEAFLRKHKFLSGRFGHGNVTPEVFAAHENDPDVQAAGESADGWISMADRVRYQRMHCAIRVPRFPSFFDRSPISLDPQSLRDTTLQVIVKMAEIRLTPDQPSYRGGKWHLEGMYNEAIAATVLVYYNLDNIADSRVAFRHAYREPDFDYQQDRYYGIEKVYGFKSQSGGSRVRASGDVRAMHGRAVAFPNFHQHRVMPFELADKTRPGRRAVLAFFVVDPGVRIPSTRDVPRQQTKWVVGELAEALGRGGRLPVVAVGEIARAAGATWTEEEAGKVARLVMEERSSGQVGGFAEAYGISLCEH
ncbi:hypothetical protein DFJ73DRAFT_841046 [Zopfochytrium polystomum]|nr:hypothetical protein DFJ73DRAFT_841046 [Zopfochytrium polystomum]